MLGRTKCPLPEDVDTVSLFSRSRLYTPELATIAMNLAENMPYGKAATFLNRTQHRSDNAVLNSVALNSCIIHWGTEIHQEQLTQAKQALLEFGFDPETGKVQEGVTLPSSITEPVIPEGEVEEAALNFIQILNEYMQKYPDTPIDIAEVASSLECPSHTTILMIDDISVKRQKEERSVNGKEGQKSAKTVINTVIWIRSPEGVYAIAAENTRQGLLMALGYMLKNHLLENRELLIFFDGAKVIRSNVEEIFAFHAPLKFYLDWYYYSRG